MSMDSEERTDSRFHSTPDPVGEGDSTPVSEGPERTDLQEAFRAIRLELPVSVARDLRAKVYAALSVAESRATDAEANNEILLRGAKAEEDARRELRNGVVRLRDWALTHPDETDDDNWSAGYASACMEVAAKLSAILEAGPTDDRLTQHPDEAAVEPCVCHEVAGDSPDCSWHPDEAKMNARPLKPGEAANLAGDPIQRSDEAKGSE